MQEKSYVFFDIDGTLLPEGCKEIPQNTIDSIKKLQENGVKVFICTGRGYHQAKKYIDDLGLDSYVTSNGQEAVVDGQEVYSYNMNDQQIKYITNKFTEYKVIWGFETRDNIYLQEDIDEIEKVKKKIEGYGLLEAKLGNIKEVNEIKQMWGFGTYEDLTCFEQSIIEDFKFYRWSKDSIEIMPLEESKAKAMKKIVELEENVKTYAFGDGYNDMELLSEAHVGVAMGNAYDELKAVSNYITDDCDKDGITKALKHFGLI